MKEQNKDLGNTVIKELNEIFKNPLNLNELIDDRRKKIFIKIVKGEILAKKQERLKQIVGQEKWTQYIAEAKKDLGSSCPEEKYNID